MLVVHASNSVILNFSTISASTLETSSSSLRLMPSQKSLLSSTGRPLPWVGGMRMSNVAREYGCQSEDHRYKLLNGADQPLESTNYIRP
jgi:hypothetical protein